MDWFNRFLRKINEFGDNFNAYFKGWLEAFDFASNNLLPDNTLLNRYKRTLDLNLPSKAEINWEAEPPYVITELDMEEDYVFLMLYHCSVYDNGGTLSPEQGDELGNGLLVYYNDFNLLNSVVSDLLHLSCGEPVFLQEYRDVKPLKNHYEIIQGKQPLLAGQ